VLANVSQQSKDLCASQLAHTLLLGVQIHPGLFWIVLMF